MLPKRDMPHPLSLWVLEHNDLATFIAAMILYLSVIFFLIARYE